MEDKVGQHSRGWLERAQGRGIDKERGKADSGEWDEARGKEEAVAVLDKGREDKRKESSSWGERTLVVVEVGEEEGPDKDMEELHRASES